MASAHADEQIPVVSANDHGHDVSAQHADTAGWGRTGVSDAQLVLKDCVEMLRLRLHVEREGWEDR
jgi:hypothetical protein